MQRASWALAPAQLGQKFPAWITRHFATVKDWAIYQPNLGSQNPSISYGSRAPGNYRMSSRIAGAVKARAEAMAKRIALALSGYNKDMAAGYRATRKAHLSQPQDSGGDE